MDVQKLINYWRCGSEEDMSAAWSLLEKKHQRHALFFAHLAVEKMLKAHIVQATGAPPPRLHDLLRLADRAALSLSAERRSSLARFQRYCLEGRYPDSQVTVPSQAEAESGLREAQEMLSWLTKSLKP